MNALFIKEFPKIIIRNIIDDGLVKEIIANNDIITSSLVRRVCSYILSAEISGADLVVITCSTISCIAIIAKHLVRIPIVRIDEPMAELAVKKGEQIKVLATLSSTLTPTVQLIKEKCQQQGKKVVLDGFLINKARQFLNEGNPKKHDQIIKEEIENALENYDLVILAQASMERVLDTLSAEKQKRVLASPKLAVEYIKRKFF
jgi:glutamate racemase